MKSFINYIWNFNSDHCIDPTENSYYLLTMYFYLKELQYHETSCYLVVFLIPNSADIKCRWYQPIPLSATTSFSSRCITSYLDLQEHFSTHSVLPLLPFSLKVIIENKHCSIFVVAGSQACKMFVIPFFSLIRLLVKAWSVFIYLCGGR